MPAGARQINSDVLTSRRKQKVRTPFQLSSVISFAGVSDLYLVETLRPLVNERLRRIRCWRMMGVCIGRFYAATTLR